VHRNRIGYIWAIEVEETFECTDENLGPQLVLAHVVLEVRGTVRDAAVKHLLEKETIYC
jgi:hypothetical protein